MMENESVNIIKNKEFVELTADEKELILELCSNEDEFYTMKSMFLNIDKIKVESITPKKETKDSLDNIFAQTYPKAAPTWYSSFFLMVLPKDKPLHRKPLIQVAAILLFVWMIYPFFNAELIKPEAKMAKNEPMVKVKDVAHDSKKTEELKSLESVPEPSNELPFSEEQVQPANTVEQSRPALQAAEDVMDLNFSDSEIVSEAPQVAPIVSTHPDGVFIAESAIEVAYEQPASEAKDLLALLSPTF